MKKLLTLLLAVGFVFGMASCGGSTSSSEESTTTEETAPASDSMQEDETIEVDSAVMEDGDTTVVVEDSVAVSE
ncbi:MAG: hypothetical protein KDC79_09515 [Cyclobacteriaceae bacterium]|nr:hypothetical protein [Cyclobacteriaceae bacterium]